MCSVILLRRPGHDWPLLLAANRDEMVSRATRPPGRHWPDRRDVVAGYDTFAGGSWLGLNDHGVVAAILNRTGSLGPAADMRSRGELVLEALDHADAMAAANALAGLNGAAYRPFNLIIADNQDAVWLCHDGREDARGGHPLAVRPLLAGLHMIAARDLDDPTCPRTRANLQRWRAADTPDPDGANWQAWETLLRDPQPRGEGPASAMFITENNGFGTRSSAIIALPAPGTAEKKPIWRDAPGLPDPGPFSEISTC